MGHAQNTKPKGTPWGFGPETKPFDEVMNPHPCTLHKNGKESRFEDDFRGRPPGDFEDRGRSIT